MINLEELVDEMKKAKNSLQEVENKLEKLQATGEAGAGLVKATFNGRKQCLNIQIDKSLLDPKEKTMLQDLTVAAINHALEKIQDSTKQEASQVVGLPNLLKDLL